MTTKTEKHIRFLSAVADERVDDLLAMTDEEILKEAAESGDSKSVVDKMRASAESLVAQSRKSKLAAARAALKAVRTEPQVVSSMRSIAEKKAAIARVLATREGLPEQLTLAAREGKGLSDADAETMYADFVALGFLTEE